MLPIVASFIVLSSATDAAVVPEMVSIAVDVVMPSNAAARLAAVSS